MVLNSEAVVDSGGNGKAEGCGDPKRDRSRRVSDLEFQSGSVKAVGLDDGSPAQASDHRQASLDAATRLRRRARTLAPFCGRVAATACAICPPHKAAWEHCTYRNDVHRCVDAMRIGAGNDGGADGIIGCSRTAVGWSDNYRCVGGPGRARGEGIIRMPVRSLRVGQERSGFRIDGGRKCGERLGAAGGSGVTESRGSLRR